MKEFYFFLWFRWAFRLTLCSLFFASVFSFIITTSIYISQGLPSLEREVLSALSDVFQFWFPISWSFTLLLALFRGLKYIFNLCISGYQLRLLSCDGSDYLEEVGYGDLVKFWRKWFMLLIWLVGSLMIISLVITYIFTSYDGVFEWFSIYWLFCFILLSGYFSFMFVSARCKSIQVVKC